MVMLIGEVMCVVIYSKTLRFDKELNLHSVMLMVDRVEVVLMGL